MMTDEGSHGHCHSDHHGANRKGARQPDAFNPERAALLDDPRRFDYLSVAQVLEMLDATSRGLLVDFGTGTGTFAIEIAKRRTDLSQSKRFRGGRRSTP